MNLQKIAPDATDLSSVDLNEYARWRVEVEAEIDSIEGKYTNLIETLQIQRDRELSGMLTELKKGEIQVGWLIRQLVAKKVADGDLNFVDTPWARLGFRASSSIEIRNMELAVKYARKNAPGAIKTVVMKSRLDRKAIERGKVPGVEVVTKSNFYCKWSK